MSSFAGGADEGRNDPLRAIIQDLGSSDGAQSKEMHAPADKNSALTKVNPHNNARPGGLDQEVEARNRQVLEMRQFSYT